MGWLTKVRVACGVVVNTAFDATASTLNTCGSLACAVGGIGFAVGQAIDKTFSTSYSGVAYAWGGMDVKGRLDHPNFSLNYTLPINLKGKKDGETNYKLTDYVDSNLVFIASSVCVGTGIVLKALGNTIKKVQQYRYDNHAGIIPAVLSNKDFLIVNTRSLCDSLTIAMLSHSIMSCVVYYSDLFGSGLHLTYPLGSEQNANCTYYNGPVTSGSYFINFPLEPQSIPIKLPFIGNTTIVLDMVLKGTTEVIYGGGIFFKANGSTEISPIVSQTCTAIGGFSAYLAGNFFTRKERYLRDKSCISQEDGTTDYHAFTYN